MTTTLIKLGLAIWLGTGAILSLAFVVWFELELRKDK